MDSTIDTNWKYFCIHLKLQQNKTDCPFFTQFISLLKSYVAGKETDKKCENKNPK